MKVFLISPGLSAGGAEKNLIWLANKLSKKCQVFFIVLTDSLALQEETINKDVKFIIFKKNKSFNSIKSLAKLINDEEPDCLISTIVNGHFVTACAKLIARSKSRHILRMSTNIDNLLNRSIKNKFYTLFSIFFADSLVVLSVDSLEKIEKSLFNKMSFGNLYKKCILIEVPYTIKKQQDKTFSSNTRVFTVSRIIKEKNLDFLIEQILRVNKKYKINFEIFGDGPDKTRLFHKFKNEDCITFNGHVPFKDINLKNFDIFVFASLNEGSPNAVIESVTNNINSLIPIQIIKTLPVEIRDLVFTYNYGDFQSFLEKFIEARQNRHLPSKANTSNESTVIKKWESLINEQIN